MARRGRIIGVALGLVVLFLIITTRHSGSHPRDLRMREEEERDELRPVIKEPPGKWDAVEDKFRKQHIAGDGVLNDELRKQNIEEDELRRKTLKKGSKEEGAKPGEVSDKIQGQPDSQRKPKNAGGSGAVGVDDTNDEKKESLEVKEYDPAEGNDCEFIINVRFGGYSHSGANYRSSAGEKGLMPDHLKILLSSLKRREEDSP
jgi:hypothetical protein